MPMVAMIVMLLQPQYNLLVRDRFEVEYAPVFAQYGMGMWSTDTTYWAIGLIDGRHHDMVAACVGTAVWQVQQGCDSRGLAAEPP